MRATLWAREVGVSSLSKSSVAEFLMALLSRRDTFSPSKQVRRQPIPAVPTAMKEKSVCERNIRKAGACPFLALFSQRYHFSGLSTPIYAWREGIIVSTKRFVAKFHKVSIILYFFFFRLKWRTSIQSFYAKYMSERYREKGS